MQEQYYIRLQNEAVVGAECQKNPHYFRDKLFESLRGYQREVFEKACNKNALLVMPTGTGKTIVSFCLAEHIRGSYIKYQTPKPVLFLTQTRALAYQQYRACQKLMVNFYMPEGQIINLLDKHASLHEAKDGKVNYVFGVKGNYLEQLKQSNTKLSHFCLVILDEAHNVTKKSPGTTIMQNFYQHEQVNRPFVLGLTATPVFQVSNIEENVTKLCGLLNADLVTVREPSNIREMEDYESRGAPHFRIVNHTPRERRVLDMEEHTAGILKNMMLQHAEHEDVTRSTTKKVYAFVENPSPSNEEPLLNELRNTAHGENFQQVEALAIMLLALNEVRQLTNTIGVSAARTHWDKQMTEMREKADVNHLQSTIESVNKTFAEMSEESGSKEVALSALIKEEGIRTNGEMRILVFVQTKAECERLSERLNTDFLRSTDPHLQGVVVDYGYRDKGANISRFEEGKVKVIICTTMYEEGIDIPNCSLVIRYFMNNFNIVALNQCRGRARRSGARFVLMVGSNEQEEKAKKNLDYSGIMRMLRELPVPKKQEAARCEWFHNYAYAERLVAHFSENNKAAYGTPMPEISYAGVGEQGVTAVTTYFVQQQEYKFTAKGLSQKLAKERLLYEICSFLNQRKLIEQEGHYNQNAPTLAEKMYETQQTALVSGLEPGANVVYKCRADWQFQKSPIDKLTELCSRNYTIRCQDKVENNAHISVLSLCKVTSEKNTSSYTARNQHNQGWATLEQARENSAIRALNERYAFSFLQEEPPLEIRDQVPEVNEEQARLEVLTYNTPEGTRVSRFSSEAGHRPPPPRHFKHTNTTCYIPEGPLPPVQLASVRPSVPDTSMQSEYTRPAIPAPSPLSLPHRQQSPAYPHEIAAPHPQAAFSARPYPQQPVQATPTPSPSPAPFPAHVHAVHPPAQPTPSPGLLLTQPPHANGYSHTTNGAAQHGMSPHQPHSVLHQPRVHPNGTYQNGHKVQQSPADHQNRVPTPHTNGLALSPRVSIPDAVVQEFPNKSSESRECQSLSGLAELRKEKENAVRGEKYEKAARLKKLITDLEGGYAMQLREAVVKEDYTRAAELKKLIEGPAPKEVPPPQEQPVEAPLQHVMPHAPSQHPTPEVALQAEAGVSQPVQELLAMEEVVQREQTPLVPHALPQMPYAQSQPSAQVQVQHQPHPQLPPQHQPHPPHQPHMQLSPQHLPQGQYTLQQEQPSYMPVQPDTQPAVEAPVQQHPNVPQMQPLTPHVQALEYPQAPPPQSHTPAPEVQAGHRQSTPQLQTPTLHPHTPHPQAALPFAQLPSTHPQATDSVQPQAQTPHQVASAASQQEYHPFAQVAGHPLQPQAQQAPTPPHPQVVSATSQHQFAQAEAHPPQPQAQQAPTPHPEVASATSQQEYHSFAQVPGAHSPQPQAQQAPTPSLQTPHLQFAQAEAHPPQPQAPTPPHPQVAPAASQHPFAQVLGAHPQQPQAQQAPTPTLQAPPFAQAEAHPPQPRAQQAPTPPHPQVAPAASQHPFAPQQAPSSTSQAPHPQVTQLHHQAVYPQEPRPATPSLQTQYYAYPQAAVQPRGTSCEQYDNF